MSERVKQGGHGIAEQDIERRYVEIFDNLKLTLQKCGLAVFYDNTIAFYRFAIYKNGSLVRVSDNVSIWYKRFTEDLEWRCEIQIYRHGNITLQHEW